MPSVPGWVVCAAALVSASTSVHAVDPPLPSERGVSANPVRWPAVVSRVKPDAAIERRITAILSRMSIEEKVAQIIQPDISAITPAEMRQYKFGSILAGGNSSPGGIETSPPAAWLKLSDDFWNAARAANWTGEPIPLMWGIDAVHGHANIVGATIFPQNIGLGATRDPALIKRIGEVTASEMAVTGFDWDFSPTLAVVRDDRWGRTYEGFSENPALVRRYAGSMVEGLQGRAGTSGFLGAGKVIATAKHFVGDGGTSGGKDQGDNPSSPQQLRDIHGAGYTAAIAAGVQAVMASFSSVRGEKVHGDRSLLTDALKRDMGFDGLLVGDWNAHGQVPGCTNFSCPAAINAGLDVFMAPDSWKSLYANTLAQARLGEIDPTRLDDAVSRILRVKLRANLFAKGAPSSRPLGGNFALLGSPAHRAVARQAVRESLVLLKNAGHLLPLSPRAHLLVAGDGADNISKQSGGWTISWQGTGLTNADFPRGTSIFAGIREAAEAAGGSAILDVAGRFDRKPDAAIVVFGEDPYAEFMGDRPHSLEFSPTDQENLDLMRRLKAAGIPVIAVFLSGRPMWVNPYLNAADAFVAAFLPGSEGGGVADVLLKGSNGKVGHDFHGKLSFSWPRRADQFQLNVGDSNYDPLFPYGFGLSYADRGDLGPLPEERPASLGLADGLFFARGSLAPGWRFGFPAGSGGQQRARDRRAQEDARSFTWPGGSEVAVALSAPSPIDISREATGQLSLVVEYRVDDQPDRPVALAVNCGANCKAQVPIQDTLRAAPFRRWTTLVVPLGCFTQRGLKAAQVTEPLSIATSGKLGLSISGVHLASAAVPQDQCGDR